MSRADRASAVRHAGERLLAAFRVVGRPLDDHLRPGLETGAVHERVADLGIEPHPSIVDLYTWHDGLDLEGAVPEYGALPSMVVGATFSPLERAASLTRSCRSIEEAGWRETWFQVFEGPEPIVIEHADPPGAGGVWRYGFPWSGFNQQIALDLESFLHDIADGVESGRYWFDEFNNLSDEWRPSS